jgi:DNA-binding beta-propeller fold protein YncE
MSPRPHARNRRPARAARGGAAIALACTAIVAAGCSTGDRAGAVGRFPQRSPARVWPAPPDVPRVRYVGQITAAADVGVRPESSLLRAITGETAPPVRFAAPAAVAAAGTRLAVADPQHPLGPTVHLIDRGQPPSWTQIREAGGAPLEWPMDVAFCDGRLAIADAKRKIVLLVNVGGGAGGSARGGAAGGGSTVVGGTAIGAGALQRPAGLAYDPRARELYVVDTGAHDIAVFDLGGALKRRIGRRGAARGEFNFPTAVALRPCGTGYQPVRDVCGTGYQPVRDVRGTGYQPVRDVRGTGHQAVQNVCGTGYQPVNSELAVADSMNFRIQLLSQDGSPRTAFGRKGDAAGDFALPRDIACDAAGTIYVLDSQFENVQMFDGDGRLLMAFATGGARPGEFNVPGGIAIDEHNWIWIADTRNRRVQAFEFIAQPASEVP